MSVIPLITAATFLESRFMLTIHTPFCWVMLFTLMRVKMRLYIFLLLERQNFVAVPTKVILPVLVLGLMCCPPILSRKNCRTFLTYVLFSKVYLIEVTNSMCPLGEHFITFHTKVTVWCLRMWSVPVFIHIFLPRKSTLTIWAFDSVTNWRRMDLSDMTAKMLSLCE